ncbi:MAG: tetratricopeptide repeat protein [Tepidisphaeraceae bacterium]
MPFSAFNVEMAERIYRLASSQYSLPMSQEALQSAMKLHQAGDLDRAEAIYRQLLARNPADSDALNLMGVVLSQRGRHEEGIELLRKAVALRPDASAYQRNLGLAYVQAKRANEAIACFRQLVAMEPGDAGAFDRLATLLSLRGQIGDAIEAGKTAVKLRPEVAGYRGHLAAAYLKARQFDLAVAQMREAARLAPDDFRYWFDLGATLAESSRYPEALEAFDRTMQLKPSLGALHSNRSAVLRQMGRQEEALAAIRRAVEIDPNAPGVQNNLAALLFDQGNLEEALIAWRNAVMQNPDYAGVRWNYARCLLALGHFAEGWEEFEARLRIGAIRLNRGFSQPQWDGCDPAGKTILLFTEGGFGDALNFIRLVPQATACGGRWFLECQPELVTLFDKIPGVERIIPRGQPLPDFDMQIPLQGLPRVLKLTLENIPNEVPYLNPPEDRVQRWAARLAGETRLRAGLAWAGSKGHKRDKPDLRTRSIDVFAPLAAVEGVKFFSLQKGDGSEQSPPAGMDLADFSGELGDFADIAALVRNLDLVVTVDTSIAHLAGALAKPVWMLVPFVADFRWLHKRTDSPWYPTMRLFREPVAGDWATPVAQMVQALREFQR